MVYELELIENDFGADQGFTMHFDKEDGTPDDLTLYDTVRLVITDMAMTSPPVRNHVDTDDELLVDSDGDLKYVPTSTNKTPVAGKYYVQVFRITTTPIPQQKPSRKFSLLVTRSTPQS